MTEYFDEPDGNTIWDESMNYSGGDYYEDEWYDDYEEHWWTDHDGDDSAYWQHVEAWSDSHELMYWCDECQKWHTTARGDALDLLYADVLPLAPYVWRDPEELPF